jgi:hypothetical protein
MHVLASPAAGLITALFVFGSAFIFPASGHARSLAVDADIVILNMRSLKYHIPSCAAAHRCTHCVQVTRKQARESGGVPCKLCGAGE